MNETPPSKGQLRAGPAALLARLTAFVTPPPHAHAPGVECACPEHALLHTALQSIDFPIYIIDANTYEVLLANRAAHGPVVPKGITCHALTHAQNTPCDGLEGGCPVDEVRRTKHAAVAEHVHYDDRGDARRYEVYAFPMVDTDGQVTKVIMHNVDVTERRRDEETLRNHERSLEMLVATLERSNQELRHFASVAAHDIRSPIALVSTSAELLKDMVEDKLDAGGRKVLDILLRSAQRTAAMIAAISHCSQVESGQTMHAPVDLNRIVEEVTSVQLALEVRQANGEIRVPEPLHAVFGDEMQVLQLVQNLISNGLKYHRTGVAPRITIRSREAGNNRIRVEVEDNGIGIRDADRAKLFQMFSRLENAREHDGLGIGLALCKKVAERHGGHIGVTSTYDVGSTFWVDLPAATAASLPPGPPDPRR